MISKEKYYEWHDEEIGFGDYLNYFKNKNPVLDLGCGIGWLGKHHNHMYGIDNDKLAIEKAKKFEKAFLCDISKEKLPFKESFFEGVIAKDIIEHVLNPIIFIKEIKRVLKEKGIIFISTKLPSKSFWDDYTHIRPYNKKSLISLLEDNDFKVKRIWYSGKWPGLGIFMKFFKKHKTPRFFFFLTNLGINRNNINIVAIKTQ